MPSTERSLQVVQPQLHQRLREAHMSSWKMGPSKWEDEEAPSFHQKQEAEEEQQQQKKKKGNRLQFQSK